MWTDAFDIEGAEEADAARAIDKWRAHTETLMAWLDWSTWQTCRPGCNVNVRLFLYGHSPACADEVLQEFCYIPTWPFVVAGDYQSGVVPRCVALNDPSVVSPGWGGPGGPGGPGRRPGRGLGQHDPDSA